MLDEMTWQNASKFAIFYIYENPKLHFSFRATLFFPLMNALDYVDRDQGIHKVAQHEKRKKQLWVFVYIKYSKF